jgi:hypothetical protein
MEPKARQALSPLPEPRSGPFSLYFDTVVLGGSGWSGTCDPPASTPPGLGLQAGTTTPGSSQPPVLLSPPEAPGHLCFSLRLGPGPGKAVPASWQAAHVWATCSGIPAPIPGGPG